MTQAPDYSYETAARARGFTRIAGLDEVGRGPLAGPVTAAAVILDPDNIPPGLNDSKKLSARTRDVLFEAILASAQVGVAHCLDRGKRDTRPDHGGLGATAPRLWLGTERRISIKKSHFGTSRLGCDPTP